MKDGENLLKVEKMLGSGSAGNQNVPPQVDKNETKLAEKAIHQPLECLSCVPRAERLLKKAKRSNNGCLTDVLSCYWNLMVPLD